MTSREIAAETAHKHGLTLADLTGPCRKPFLCMVRREAMYQVRTETDLSWRAIARIFNRTKQSVMYHVRNHGKLLEQMKGIG